MPAYPRTSITGIAHFIHGVTPCINESQSSLKIQQAITREMSEVCIAYAVLRYNLD